MLEFSSISVSSYDAASLADRLTEKSAQGWDLVAIVPAGTNVTAYLSRAAGTAPAVDHSVSTPEAEAAAAALTTTDVPDATPEPVEPAGWASAPAEPAETSASAWGDSATDAVTTAAAADAPVDVAPAPVDVQPAPAQPEPAQPEPVQQPATAAAPAGWYADPAGRYELRYWDGTQWTEHVSRAGQQYTDPPVA